MTYIAPCLLIILLLVSGCGSQYQTVEHQPTQTSGFGSIIKDLGVSPAGEAASNNLKPLYSVGTFLLIAGALGGLLLRSSGIGITLGGTGLMLITAGVLFTQYPWFTLLCALFSLLILGIHLLLKTRQVNMRDDGLTELVRAVEEEKSAGNRIKANLRTKGKDVEEIVRKVVRPLKQHINQN